MPKPTDSFGSAEINENLRKWTCWRIFRKNHWCSLAYAFTVVEQNLHLSVYIYFSNL